MTCGEPDDEDSKSGSLSLPIASTEVSSPGTSNSMVQSSGGFRIGRLSSCGTGLIVEAGDGRLNMEVQKNKLIELIESEFGLLDKLRSRGALTKVKIAKVKSGATLFEKNEFLLNYIFSENKHQDLMTALVDCGQHHVVNWVKGNGEYKEEFGLDWPLTETDEKILDCNQEILVDLLNVDELLSNLYAVGVFNKRQRESIGSEPTEHERSEALLDAVRRFSLKSYFTFKECLRQSGQSHVADILENGGIIVPVHAMLECENLDDIETQIVNKMTQGANDLMTDASSEQRHRLIAALYLNVIAFRRGKGIVIYTSCSKEEEFVHLCEIIDNLEMRNILQQLFNLLVSNVKIKVVLVDVLSKDIAKAKQIFDEKAAILHKALTTVSQVLQAPTTINMIPLEILDIIIKKSCVLFIQRNNRAHVSENGVLKQLASVSNCWFKRMTKRRFKKTIWSFLSNADHLNMEVQKDRLIELIEGEFGLLDKLLSCGALTRVQMAKFKHGRTVFEKNDYLLRYIFSGNKHQDLMKALSDCGQYHVVNWVRGNGEYNEEYGYDWPLRETEVKILDRHQEALVNYLHASEILPILHVMQGINKRQRESIDSEPTEYQKNEALLETVRRFSLKSYSVFIQCIRMSGHSHVADLLEYDGCVVPVHARLECEDLDKVKTRIVNQMENVLIGKASMQQAVSKRKNKDTKDKDQGLEYQDKDSEERRWKMTFDRHHDFIVDRMSPDFGLIDKLYSHHVLTEDEIDEIEMKIVVRKRNENLIKCIRSKCQLGKLIEFLGESGQRHLVKYLENDGNYSDEFDGEWPLSEKEISTIKNNYEPLIDLLEISDLLYPLYSTGVINKRQREFISSKSTSYEKNKALLEIVRRGSLRSYRLTIRCLHQSDQSHIAEILETGGAIVPVHATLECENLGKVETRIVDQMADVLKTDASVDEIERYLAALRLRLIVAKRGS